MIVETDAVRKLVEMVTGRSLTGTPSTSADTPTPVQPNYVPDLEEDPQAPGSKDPDYVPDLEDVIEELLATQRDDAGNFEPPLRPKTAELLTGNTTRSFRSAHMLKVSGNDHRARALQGMLFEKSKTERGRIRVSFFRQMKLLLRPRPDWDYQILVQAEVVPKGMRHARVWSKKAIIGDWGEQR